MFKAFIAWLFSFFLILKSETFEVLKNTEFVYHTLKPAFYKAYVPQLTVPLYHRTGFREAKSVLVIEDEEDDNSL